MHRSPGSTAPLFQATNMASSHNLFSYFAADAKKNIYIYINVHCSVKARN